MKGFQEWLFIHDVMLEAFCLFLDKEVWDITLHLRLISCFGDNIGEMFMTNQFIKKGFGLVSTSAVCATRGRSQANHTLSSIICRQGVWGVGYRALSKVDFFFWRQDCRDTYDQ